MAKIARILIIQDDHGAPADWLSPFGACEESAGYDEYFVFNEQGGFVPLLVISFSS
ncbi:hypothetical protein [Paenibacillus sp. FSL R7-0179]|uniref:hypothetical protein n=1 Tax=Paenibacillus sp. FSL R7-0179 TaxID=2921672 RepID=UPI0030F58166